jgi:hypothetical protein
LIALGDRRETDPISCIAFPLPPYYDPVAKTMKTLTVKVPEPVLAEIEATAKARRVSKSEIVRERLSRKANASQSGSLWNLMEDLVIDDDSLPKDLSSNKSHLENYGANHPD